MNKGIIFLVAFLFLSFFGGFYFTGKYIQNSYSGDLVAEIDEGIIVLDKNFRGQGESTNFLSKSDLELEDISDLILEVSSYGKVRFQEGVNLTKDFVWGLVQSDGSIVFEGVFEETPFARKIVNLEDSVSIIENNISVNVEKMPSLNKSAFIYIYNLDFKNPVIYKDGNLCPLSECIVLSYVEGTLIFSVNSFSSYWAGEGEIIEDEGESSGDSGGGGGTIPEVSLEEGKASFFVEDDFLWIKIIQGEESPQILEIVNNGDKSLVLDIFISEDLRRFLPETNKTINLSPGEKKIVPFNFYALTNQRTDAYTGYITIKQGSLEKRVNVLIEIFERNPIFDVFVKVQDRIFYGNNVRANLEIINMGPLKGFDIVLFYSIRDFEGNIISYREESIYMEDKLILTKDLSFPRFKKGSYVFYTNVSYGEIGAHGSDYFVVEENPYFLAIVVIISILIFIIIILLIPRYRYFFFNFLRGRKALD